MPPRRPPPDAATSVMPLEAIGRHCLDCSGGSFVYLSQCPRNGYRGPPCPLWPHRFGITREEATARHGIEAVDPQAHHENITE